MKKVLSLVLLGLLMILTMSCDELINPGDVSLTVSPTTQNFIWETEVTISAIATKVDELDKIVFSIDGEEVFEDNIEPFEYVWNTATVTYEAHEIKAVGHYDNKTSRDDITVYYSPCPIFADDLVNIEDITETNISGDLIGTIDDDDWHFGDEITGNTFGPGFPNPADVYCNLPFTLEEQEYVTIIVINRDNEIIDVICNKEQIDAGDDHYKTFQPEANVSNIYRMIFHINDNEHWYGDVIVE